MTTQFKITRADITADAPKLDTMVQFEVYENVNGNLRQCTRNTKWLTDEQADRWLEDHKDEATKENMRKVKRQWPIEGTQSSPAKPTTAQAASVHTPECGDRWEPLREKLSIRQAQYLNTYTRTGDIAALNCLVLGIVSQRDETAAQRDQARKQVKTLLAACNAMENITTQDATSLYEYEHLILAAQRNLSAAIASVESEGQ